MSCKSASHLALLLGSALLLLPAAAQAQASADRPVRVVKELGGGLGLGMGGLLGGALLGLGVGAAFSLTQDHHKPAAPVAFTTLGGAAGTLVGLGAGVYLVGHHELPGGSPGSVALGELVGLGAGILLALLLHDEEADFQRTVLTVAPLVLAPLVGATIGYEISLP